MGIDGIEINLSISGMGIILYSPQFARHIAEGSDYLKSNYTTEQQVQSHIQKGTLVGFGTGTPGDFIVKLHSGYPDEDYLQACTFRWVSTTLRQFRNRLLLISTRPWAG